MSRSIQVGIVACILVGGVLFWALVIDPARRHLAFSQAVRAEFEALAKKRPPNVTRKQWENVVAWTLNAKANCIDFAHRIPQGERDRFLAELRERVRGPVDLATIDWIWDEIIRLTPGGQRYSDNWRPTSPERLQEFEEGNLTWGIEVD
jgi:hypothetical protein